MDEPPWLVEEDGKWSGQLEEACSWQAESGGALVSGSSLYDVVVLLARNPVKTRPDAVVLGRAREELWC